MGSKTDGTRRTAIAPRISWSLYRGEIPENISVLHSCDNPYCVNPDHLFLGTQVDNMQDCANKGRTSRGEEHSAIQKAHIPTGEAHWRFGKPVQQGEQHWANKLTENEVRAIRADPRTYEQIAKDYHITFQHVAKIKDRTRWKNVK